jgi:hypothetical protein
LLLKSLDRGFGIIEISQLESSDLPRLLSFVGGCWKSSSILWLKANSFPVLEGLILNSWSARAERAISSFCARRLVSELLLRIEKPGRRWTQRRGGYTVSLAELRPLVEDLANENLLIILLEPASPYADEYSLSCVLDIQTGKLDVEVVGIGFDASDLLRGDIHPHERFELSLLDGRSKVFSARRVHIVDDRDYRISVERRLAKIGAKLRNPSFPKDVLEVEKSAEMQSLLTNEAKHFLKSVGQTSLLEDNALYQAIPENMLWSFAIEVSRIFDRIRAATVKWRTLSLAASFLPGRGLVIWDFFVPEKADTNDLCLL